MSAGADVSAGELRERVTLLTPVTGSVSDGRGGRLPAGPDAEATLYARVRPLRSTEKLYLGVVLNSDAYEITIRYRPGVTPTCRVRWGDTALNVQGIQPDERKRYLKLTCFSSGK